MKVAAALVFAVIWQRVIGRGPLETVVAVASGRVRQAVAARIPAEGQRQAKQPWSRRAWGYVGRLGGRL